jgi:hypothetical protein
VHRLHENRLLVAEYAECVRGTGKEVLITQSGEGELELRMRDALHLPETSTTASKSKKAADLASLDRRRYVPMKCESPVSPSSVRSSRLVTQRRTRNGYRSKNSPKSFGTTKRSSPT